MNRHGSTQSPHQGADMGKSDALSRLVLSTGAAEQVKNSLMVLGIDAAAIVGDFENRKAKLGPAPDRDFPGNSGLEVFERVVEQVREDLFQRQAVADDVRQRLDANLGLGFGGLMRHRCSNAFYQFAGIDPHRLELAPPLAGEVEDGADQAIHLGDRGFDEFQGLGEVLRELVVFLFEDGFRRSEAWRSAATRLKIPVRNSSSSLVKPMMFTSGERRSWLTI